MSRHILHIAVSVALALAMWGCSVDGDPTPSPARVLLVYVGTDNNLSGYEQAKLAALREGWTGLENDRIIAYIDDRSGQARLIEISNLSDGDQPRGIATYGTENSASPTTLSRVITDVRTMYPADSYGLLVFSHASGWLPRGVYNEFAKGRVPDAALSYSACAAAGSRSIIIDGTDEMSLTDFAAAIPDGAFDYIVFEACFMAGAEVAYELRNKTPLIFASSTEIVDPGFAPVYSSATRQLFGQNLAGFGQSVFTHTLTYAETSPQRSGTYSVISTADLDALAAFIRDNCDFSHEVDIDEVQGFDRLTNAALFFDFRDYYGRLLENDSQRDELSRLLENCVRWKAATDEFMTQSASYNGFAINSHSGLTTYIPQAAYPGLNTAHGRLGWTQATRPD